MLNFVLTFLVENRKRLDLEGFGDPMTLASVMGTPRFKASSHLIFFILQKNKTQPVLVAKVPRIVGEHSRLDREAQNLYKIQSLKPGGFDSVPRVLAYEDFMGHRLLIGTALPGQTMRPAFVRRNREFCLETGLNWLTDLHLTSKTVTGNSDKQMEPVANVDLEKLKVLEKFSKEEKALLAETDKIANTIKWREVPSVFEHGDFSSPNILISETRRLGVVDWELAELKGLPAVDLFFFLSYIAFAMGGASKSKDYIESFRRAFFGEEAWARSYIERYWAHLSLSPDLARGLFVISWSRYVAGLITRLSESNTTLGEGMVNWVFSNRYYQMWRYAVDHYEELNLI